MLRLPPRPSIVANPTARLRDGGRAIRATRTGPEFGRVTALGIHTARFERDGDGRVSFVPVTDLTPLPGR